MLVILVEKKVKALEPIVQVGRPVSGLGRERVVEVEVNRVDYT